MAGQRQTPFRGEKATNWEGGYRTPCLIRWPGVIKPGTIYNDMFAHEDLLPTFAAAAGDTDVVERCKKSCKSGAKSFKVHLDGYNLIPFFKGEVKESPRHEFLYWSDDGDLFAVRVGPWKISFIEQYHTGMDVWRKGFEHLRRISQFARRPLRAWTGLRRLQLGIFRPPLVRHPARTSRGCAVARQLQGIPDPAEAREL